LDIYLLIFLFDLNVPLPSSPFLFSSRFRILTAHTSTLYPAGQDWIHLFFYGTLRSSDVASIVPLVDFVEPYSDSLAIFLPLIVAPFTNLPFSFLGTFLLSGLLYFFFLLQYLQPFFSSGFSYYYLFDIIFTIASLS
jgi:hypothetical protein